MATNAMKSKVMEVVSRLFIPMEFKQNNFRFTPTVELVDADIGHCIWKMKVEERHVNHYGTLHGGMVATLVDEVSSAALIKGNEEGAKDLKLGVTVHLSVEYLKAARLGEEILVEGRVLKRGKTLAYLEAEIKRKDTNELLMKGSHIKFMA